MDEEFWKFDKDDEEEVEVDQPQATYILCFIIIKLIAHPNWYRVKHNSRLPNCTSYLVSRKAQLSITL